MSQYATVALKEVAKIMGGKRLPKGDSFCSQPTAHPYIRARDIEKGRIELTAPMYIEEKTAKKLLRYKVSTGDICLTIAGTIGEIGIVPAHLNNANLTENAVKITSKDCFSQQFLKYALLTDDSFSQMKNLAGGAAQPKLGIYKVETIQIPAPSLSTQRKIAAILSAYDDLIENNLRRIKILEEMAQNLYREWFVKFRFPGYEKVKFVDSPLGMIPEGWVVRRMEEVLSLRYGKALKKDDRSGGNIPVYGSSGVVGYHDTSLASGPGIVVGRKGNVGSVFWSEKDFFVIDTAYYVESEMPLIFLYYDLQGKNFLNNDAAVPGLSRNQAYSLPMIVPPADLLSLFSSYAKNLVDGVLNGSRQNDILRKSRDLLLPRLVSGEVDVSDLDIEIPEGVIE
jgi:type I restriction enzyme S subunit